MLGPGWGEGCIGCSFGADHIEGSRVHLEHHDVSGVVVSRAPLAEIEAYKKRMGWRFSWVSSYGSDFNYDYHVSFTPEELANGKVYYNYRMTEGGIEELAGLSVFFKDGADIFHTYSSYARGAEELLTTYMVLDLTPKGRNETGPHHNLMDWVKRHDEYEKAPRQPVLRRRQVRVGEIGGTGRSTAIAPRAACTRSWPAMSSAARCRASSRCSPGTARFMSRRSGIK